jgi:acyl-CoA reductase-like NAD-dependent aldehyde dehydrogenase
MGGKNPLIVLDDADLERAVAIALDGSFFATGQRCTASSRLIVRTASTTSSWPCWPRRSPRCASATPWTPTPRSARRSPKTRWRPATSTSTSPRAKAAAMVTGGGRLKLDNPGWYVQPTLIADTDKPDMRINNEEVFGPVASTIRVKDYEEALEIANGVEFGLSAGIATTSLKYARHFQRHAKAGMTMVNLATAGVDYHVPFGGIEELQLRRARAGLRGGRVLHPDQNLLLVVVSACPQPSIPA